MDDRLKIPTEWQNIGDVNPERHGGIFIRYDNVGDYHVIETRHYADLPDGLTESEHMFEHSYVPIDDMLQDPEDLSKGFTDWFLRKLDEYHNPVVDPVYFENPENELPENETIGDLMEWVLEEKANELISTFLHSHVSYYGGYSTDFDSDYWGYLENHGIDKENF